MAMHVLFEHASGYALFKVKEMEEIGMLLPEMEAGVADISRFNGVVKLVAFYAFKTGTNALDNINSISEGILHDDLKIFLDTNLPKSSKKSKSTLGISDTKIGGAIADEFKVSCQHTGVVPEIIRGIRQHFPYLIKGLTDRTAVKAQLGLAHSYSRAKVKFNVHRVDNMIIQSIATLDMFDKNLNTFTMRIREWYGYHFPELKSLVSDNYSYACVVKIIGNRKLFVAEEKREELEEFLQDSAKVQQIIDAIKSSIGTDISEVDLSNANEFSDILIAKCKRRERLSGYLKGRMGEVSPNLSTLLGEQVGARLISQAGSLTNLAKCPASTLQILGAEKALFRALKTKSATPKYGLIYHSSFITRAGTKNKGRISRYLANKCSIASRIDCFSENTCNVYGEHLKEQVEERLKYYQEGETPRKNTDVMKEAHSEATAALQKRKKKEKKKKRKSEKLSNGHDESVMDSTMDTTTADDDPEPEPAKKSKKKRKSEAAQEVQENGDDHTPAKKEKKKKKRKSEAPEPESESEAEAEPVKKKKKKKRHSEAALDSTMDTTAETVETPKKKKKKSKKSLD